MCFWITLIVLFVALVTTPPVYPYSRRWGYYPSGGAFLLIVLLLLLWWFAWLPAWYHAPVAR
jgi:hypothetical protein